MKKLLTELQTFLSQEINTINAMLTDDQALYFKIGLLLKEQLIRQQNYFAAQSTTTATATNTSLPTTNASIPTINPAASAEEDTLTGSAGSGALSGSADPAFTKK